MKSHPYRGQKAIVATAHSKTSLVAPAFEDLFHMGISEFVCDTDQFGTFSGEIERTLSPLDAAIAKAKLGAHLSNSPLVLASEGSIGPDSVIPLVTSDVEHLVLYDSTKDHVISAWVRSFDIVAKRIVIEQGDPIESFLASADFPHHQLIVRPEISQEPVVFKGIRSEEELWEAISHSAEISAQGRVVLESDLRAHCSPSRQENIRWVARELAKKVDHLCTECEAPGWGVVGVERGLPCRQCGTRNEAAISGEYLGCSLCSNQEFHLREAQSIGPESCIVCNP